MIVQYLQNKLRVAQKNKQSMIYHCVRKTNGSIFSRVAYYCRCDNHGFIGGFLILREKYVPIGDQLSTEMATMIVRSAAVLAMSAAKQKIV